jgi:hypothetical protein
MHSVLVSQDSLVLDLPAITWFVAVLEITPQMNKGWNKLGGFRITLKNLS